MPTSHALWRPALLWWLCLISPLVSAQVHKDGPFNLSSNTEDLTGWYLNDGGLLPRQDQGRTCTASQPCAGGECCSGVTFFCGIDEEHCATGTCISNCDATAECGQYADPPGKPCPLNVCCGQWGFCGVTDAFCSATELCQSNCQQPPATNLNTGNVTALVIGYLEAWNLQLDPGVGCAYRSFDWIPIDSISHLNVAFGYILPDTFTIAPMPGVHIETIKNITAIKQRAPGLQIWLSLGGWTYSDNDTNTQPVWGDVVRTPASRAQFITNLASFMTEWGFDGVDLDWEYPGAPDRGGGDDDTANYVSLVKDIRNAWDARVAPVTWGLSFTAPTSYWYMRWFDIGNMTQYVDWMNLMTYDLHGSWDSPTDQIGSNVFAHTNMTEITSALDLLWRNDVPANKVNLGIGFYGRSYTLSDPNCRTPGCPFTAAGKAGSCTGTAGILSYQELTAIRDTKKVPVSTDSDAQVVYFTYDNDQWVSYDDVYTLAAKRNYANENGLLGLFIWAIDQDDQYHTALNALSGLGKFAAQNGVGSYSAWSGASAACYLGDCAANPVCDKTGTAQLGESINCARGERRNLCCPIDNMPDPDHCEWVEGNTFLVHGDGCNSAKCTGNQVQIAASTDYIINGGDATCLDSGTAKYCCDGSESGSDVCGPVTDQCFHQADIFLNKPGVCPNGRKAVTWSAGTCDTKSDWWQAWCCAEEAVVSGCYWTPGTGIQDDSQCANLGSCKNNEVDLGFDYDAQGKADCSFTPNPTCGNYYDTCYWPPQRTAPRHFCCPAGDLNIKISTVPVPLQNLFPSTPPDTNQNDWQIDVDHIDDSSRDDDADRNAFGWHIISGPQQAVTSMDKRDGSHWELVGCDAEKHEGRRTVQAVCTDDSEQSNCDYIFRGGVAATVVRMPPGCGPGKYAVAVSMEPSSYDALPPAHRKRLTKRYNVTQPRVYDYTFDYDYEPVTKRDDASQMLLRIDYSDDPGYWGTVVSMASGSSIGKREELEAEKERLRIEVDRDHGGSWHRFMDHKFSLERRATPDHQLHELHARWFSADLANWLRALRYVDHKYEAVRHSINKQYQWYLFDYANQCDFMGIPQESYLRIWTELDINTQVSGEISLIGDLGNLQSFNQSSVLFRTIGDITTSLNVEAFAQLTFSSNRIELFGLDTFGATFSVPGLVTIGPNFQVFGQLDGQAGVHAEAQVVVDLAHWDYTQQYPNQPQATQDEPTRDQGVVDNARKGLPAGTGEAGSSPQFHADVAANGYLTVTISPLLTFGITWALASVPDTSIDFGMDSYATMTASAEGSIDNSGAGASVCYAISAGYQVYARVNAP